MNTDRIKEYNLLNTDNADYKALLEVIRKLESEKKALLKQTTIEKAGAIDTGKVEAFHAIAIDCKENGLDTVRQILAVARIELAFSIDTAVATAVVKAINENKSESDCMNAGKEKLAERQAADKARYQLKKQANDEKQVNNNLLSFNNLLNNLDSIALLRVRGSKDWQAKLASQFSDLQKEIAELNRLEVVSIDTHLRTMAQEAIIENAQRDMEGDNASKTVVTESKKAIESAGKLLKELAEFRHSHTADYHNQIAIVKEKTQAYDKELKRFNTEKQKLDKELLTILKK